MHNAFYSRFPWAALCSCWICGLITGILAAAYADIKVVSLMRLGAFRRVSIVWLLLWCALPFLITAWSVMINKVDILFLGVFCRCFFFGFFLWLELRAFGSAAWLAVSLSRFSDWLSLMIFCGFLFRSRQLTGFRKLDFGMALFLSVLAVIFDFLLVSPFLAKL